MNNIESSTDSDNSNKEYNINNNNEIILLIIIELMIEKIGILILEIVKIIVSLLLM